LAIVSELLNSETIAERTEYANKDPNKTMDGTSGLTARCNIAHTEIPIDIGCLVIFFMYVGKLAASRNVKERDIAYFEYK
jgi:hypothetical protein